MKNIIFLTTFCFFISICYAHAEDGFTQRDRELLIELKVKIHEIDKRFEQLDKRFEQVDKRFEQVDKRFEELRDDMNKRFEQVDKRFDQMFTFLWILTGIFTTLTVSVIGFAYWDRRTMIRKAKEETMEEIERHGLSANLLKVLRELAKEDSKLAGILRQFNLL